MGTTQIVSRAKLPLALSALAVLAILGGTASAERSQSGNVIVTLNGGLTPIKLPRDHSIPVAVNLEGGVDTSDDSPLPRVNRLKLELAWRGELMTKGLPICTKDRLKGLRTKEALAECGGALVGRGKLKAKIFVPNQSPFGVRAYLLAFNGRTKVGRRAVLVHAFTSNPPTSFVIPFVVHRQPGSFHTVLVTTIRRAVGTWPHVSSFKVNIARSFLWRGRHRSYLNASCPVPPHFTSGFLSFARATYTFEDGKQLTTTSVRSCRAS